MRNFLIGLLITVTLFGTVGYMVASAPTVDGYVEMFSWEKEIVVESGDRLWNLASPVNKNSQYDTRLIVEAIKKVNGISSSIRPGQRILVPSVHE